MGQPSNGLLISFDGIDSSGKATQVKELARRLRFQGHIVQLFQTPDYTTKTGQQLKTLLQQPDEWQKVSWLEKMTLFATNRREHRTEVVSALQRQEIVIYDRYIPSSLAFFAVEAMAEKPSEESRTKAHAAVSDLEYKQHEMPAEDVSVFLDIEPQVASRLLEKRKEQLQEKDEYTDHLAVQQHLYNEYDLLIGRNPEQFLRIHCLVGDQLLSIPDVAELVWSGLLKRFPQLHLSSPWP